MIANRVDAHVQGRLVARAFDGGVDADAFLGRVAENLEDIVLTRIKDRFGDAKCLDPAAAVLIRLADKNLARADGATGEDGKRANRAGAGNQHRAPAADLGAIDAVESHRGRLDQCALLVRHAIGDEIGVVVVDDRDLPHAAPWPAEADAAHVRAQVIEAASAVVVVERHHQRLDGNAIAALDAADFRAGFKNLG